MDCRPTLLLIAVTLAGVAGARWVAQISTKPPLLTLSEQRLSSTDSQQLTPLISAAEHPTYTITARPNHLSNGSNREVITTRTPAQSEAVPSTAQANPVNASPSVQQLLADQGITLAGINDNSDHVDALFTAYFDQTDIDSDHAMEIILGDWAKSKPAEAWQWIQSNDTTGALHQFRATVVQYWLPLDADAALMAIVGLTASDDKNELLADYAAFIATKEPDRAFFWAYGLSDANARQQALDRVVYQWASSDPEQVIIHLSSITEPDIRQQLLFQAGPTITAQLTQTNPYQAMTWTDTLNENEFAFLTPIAFQQWININPTDAIAWLATEKNYQNSELYMASAATTLAYQNLPIALEVFPTMTDSVQESMASSIAFSLYQIDPNDAKTWSFNQTNPAVQLKANRGMLLASVDTEPEFALQMALDYVGQDQNEVLVTTVTEVDQQHPDLLETWLLNAPINDTQLQNIQTALVRSPPD